MSSQTQTITDMKSLKDITQEIKRMAIEIKKLNLQKKVIEERIKEYLEENNQPGIRYGELVILANERKGYEKITKNEKKNKIYEVLQNNGVDDPIGVYDEILKSSKGEEKKIVTLKLKG